MPKRRAARRLRVETEQLRNALLSSVSHDLRTPLAEVTGVTSALLERAPRDEDKRRLLVMTAHEEALRLSQLVRNLLDMTRVDAGALCVRKELQPVEEVIGAALTRLEDRLRDREVETDVPEELLAPFDSILIEQVLINLLDNAAKYTPAGTSIEVTAVLQDREVQVEVADHGPGVPEKRRLRARLRQVLPRGSRTRGGRRGTGADHLPRGGARPRGADLGRGPARGRRLVSLHAAAGPPGCRGRRDVVSDPPRTVLVVDDEAQMRTFVRIALEAYGFQTLEASTAAEGLRQAAAHVPDLVLLDLGLPDADGGEVTRRIREWSNLPILIISARGTEASKVRALDEGADDYITKPFGAAELMARIRVALRKAGPAREVPADVIHVGKDIRVDLARRIVVVRGKEVHLAPIEYKLLATLVRHAGRVVTHHQLIEQVWGPGQGQPVQTLRVYMTQLRHKLERQPARPRYLLTETGIGYRLRLEV